MSYFHKCKGGCGCNLPDRGYCQRCGEKGELLKRELFCEWPPDRAAADPAGACAWAKQVRIDVAAEKAPHGPLSRPQAMLFDAAVVEIVALRSLVRELAAAVEIGLHRPGHDAMYVALERVPDELKGGSDAR